MDADRMLGHYRLAERLGAGGMGEVFRARDTKLDRDVAVKLLPDAFTSDPERHARFHREARSMAAFSHVHVASVHALEEHEGQHFLVMELVDGSSLAELLAQGPLPVPRALALARQLAAGLEAAHAAGIIHRDLKPANVMITAAGEVKILDFGLAKVFADAEPASSADDPTLTTDRTRAGVVLGTAAYMSPEQARGAPVDRRTDVWAFGAVLFEMVAGERPFRGETVTDTLAAVLRAEPPWSALPPDLPAPVARLLLRCLQKDPRRRLHDVADARIVLEDLEAPDGPYAAAFAAGAGPGPLGAVGPSRNRGPAVVPLIVTVAALAIAAWALWLRPEPAPRPPRARSLTFSGRDWSPTASPDGQLVAFTSDRDGVSRIWLKQLAGGGETPLTDGPDDMPRFSPDGAQLLFAHDDSSGRDIYRIPVLGGQPRKILSDAVEADWSPDGRRVAFLRASHDGGNSIQSVGIAALQSGEERILHTGMNILWYGVRWSPDGRWIAVNTAALSGNVAAAAFVTLVGAEDGSVRELTFGERRLPCGSVDWAPSGQAFVVSQPSDLLAHVLGYPGLIMESSLDGSAPRPVAWLPIRLPRGGWGFSSLAVLDRHRLVLDEAVTIAVLRELILDADGRPGEERELTTGLSRDRQPDYAPDGRTVIFSSNRSGNVDLWLCDRQTGRLRQLTDDAASDWDPAFTPDGRGVLWSSDRSGNMEVWMSAADGSDARQVSTDGKDAENPTMTPDGAWIVYASGSGEKLGVWKVRPDGTDATLLLRGPYLLPEVSPDGRHVLCVTVRDLSFVVNALTLADGELLPFEIVINPTERQEDLMLGRARWTPDGRGIVFIGQDASGHSGVYVQDFAPEGGTEDSRRPLAGFSHRYTTESLGFAPDGRSVTIAATFEQRTLKLVEDLDLRLWR